MTQVIAIIRDGAVHDAHGMPISAPREPSRAVAAPERQTRQVIEPIRDPVDEVAALLARVTRLAQQMNAADQRRCRDLVHAASAVLNASTCLPRDDQRLFEAALRNAKT